MAKKVDPKAKAKRQKIYAAVGGVLLLALLAFQVPRTMKMLNAQAPPPPTPASSSSATAPAGADPSVLPTPANATAAAAAAPTNASMTDSDAPPAPEAGQLVSFGRFQSKDPFAAQIDEAAVGSGGGEPAAPAGSGGGSSSPSSPSSPSSSSSPPSTTGNGGGITTGGSQTGGGESSTGGKPAATAGAVISVNGVEESVSVKSEFPADAPVFVLVSLTKTEAKIAIAGGALASGAPTVTLRLGKPLTLVNTADGVRYELKLVKTG